MICFISLSKESDIYTPNRCILSCPISLRMRKNQIGLGIPIIKSSTKTLLRSTFWWILGPVLRLLSGDGSDGFTESTTLGWIWMYTDTGWNQTYELLSFKHTIFVWASFLLKHGSQRVFFTHWQQPKQITRIFFVS